MLLAFNKPFGIISQFTPDGSTYRTLADFNFPPSVYPLGRLDADSEGLLLLSDEPSLNARLLDPQPQVPPRDPPIRVRKTVPTCWIALDLIEGKNRQVRRMTAAVDHPTLRLLRVQIGKFPAGDLPPGKWRELSPEERKLAFASNEIT